MESRILSALLLSLLSLGVLHAEQPEPDSSLIDRRIKMERKNRGNPFVLIPHRTTYVLPFSYARTNTKPYQGSGLDFQDVEFKAQVSFKLQAARGVLGDNSFLYFAYTQMFHWQAYNTEASSPFRNSNHEAELFITLLSDYRLLGVRQRILNFGLNHQSNGRSVPFSRSWNRLFVDVIMEKGPLYLSFKPWWRIPEEAKKNPLDAVGDDNPDIDDYMGYAELLTVYEHGKNRYSLLLRNNLRSENRGAVQIDWNFPFRSNLRGYIQFFEGYGENMLDYDYRSRRIGFGVLLVGWL